MALLPDGAEAANALAELPVGKPLQVEITRPRNLAHHRLFWKLCARIGEGIGKDAEWIERAFKVETGHFDHFTHGDKDTLVLRSIAFHKMDQTEFSRFFEECVNIAYARWGVEPAALADLLAPNESQKR